MRRWKTFCPWSALMALFLRTRSKKRSQPHLTWSELASDSKVHAYIEPHIEQGPVLESKGLPIAAVTSIQGLRWFSVEVDGRAGHAGTTPMTGRRDAFQGALRAIERSTL